MPQSSPGPDGLTYTFWAAAPDATLGLLEMLARQATRGQPVPKAMLHSYTVFIPKWGYIADAERIVRRIKELRPIILMQTAARLLAATANSEL